MICPKACPHNSSRFPAISEGKCLHENPRFVFIEDNVVDDDGIVTKKKRFDCKSFEGTSEDEDGEDCE